MEQQYSLNNEDNLKTDDAVHTDAIGGLSEDEQSDPTVQLVLTSVVFWWKVEAIFPVVSEIENMCCWNISSQIQAKLPMPLNLDILVLAILKVICDVIFLLSENIWN